MGAQGHAYIATFLLWKVATHACPTFLYRGAAPACLPPPFFPP